MPKLDSSARQAAEQPRSVAPRNSNHQKPLGAMAIIEQGFRTRADPGLNANKKRRLYAPPRWVHHPSRGLRRRELEVGGLSDLVLHYVLLELPLNRLHLIFQTKLQLLQPHFFQLFVFGEITFLGK